MIVANAGQAADLLAPLLGTGDREMVAVLHLGPGRRLLAITLEEEGGGDETELPIRAIIAKALALDAEGMVVAHNHPSGNPAPSAADEAATRALAFAATDVGIRLHDHLIFAGGEWASFRDLGLI